jgi:hypothetical protein
MLYKFKSKASGDVIMLAANGDAMLRILGREPAAQGIVEPAAMPAAIGALERAVAESEAQASTQANEGDESNEAADGPRAVGLRQRLWPMIDLLKRSHAAGEPVVWGV